MANKKKNTKQAKQAPARPIAVTPNDPAANNKVAFDLVTWIKTNPYAPGLLLFLFTLIIGLIVYKDYGIAWDEPLQRAPGLLSYDFIFNGSDELFQRQNDNHGAGFELLLVIIEKMFSITDDKAIYEMRHLVTHVVFLAGAFAGYVLAYRLFKDRFIASLGFIMLVLAPRLYAHSYFNSKDIPFVAMVLITLMLCQAAFEKKKRLQFLLLGLACGYATSIRIMGVMYAAFIGLFMLTDLISGSIKKDDTARKTIVNLLIFCTGFGFTVFIAWPYLWKDPVGNFIGAFTKLSHYDLWTGLMLLDGKYVSSMKLPWTYFPTWFLISNPILWLVIGFGGILSVCVAILRKPVLFIANTTERNLLLYLLSFAAPIAAVILMHSVIYDDWRHLYFVYPPFVMLGLYFIHSIYKGKYKMIVAGVCAVQVMLTGWFMVRYHPFQNVYFNQLVSHADESLRKNYELDYWGCSFKSGLDHLVKENPTGPIKVYNSLQRPVINNVLMLNEQDRNRVQLTTHENADYIITNFRNHIYDYPFTDIDYSIKVLNSTILRIYKQDPDTVKRKQKMEQEIAVLNKELAAKPGDYLLESTLGDAYFFNNQYDSATMHYLRVLTIKPDDLALIDIAGDFFMHGHYEDAIKMCKKAIEQVPDDLNAHINTGLCYMRLHEFDSAVVYLRQAAVIDNASAGAYQNLAYAYRAIGNVDSAKKYEAMAQKITPEFRLK